MAMMLLRRGLPALLLTLLPVFCGAQNDASLLEALRRSAPEAVAPAFQSSALPLLQSLHDLTGQGYRAQSYSAASDYMFSTADGVVRDGRRGVVDSYSGVFVPGTSKEGSDYRERGDQNGDGFVDGQGMNVEHTWPQSFFAKRMPMKSDLHHLLPTFIHPNGVRGSMPFGLVRGYGEYNNAGGAKAGGGVFEPPDAVKGRVARCLLYFYTRYYDQNISNGGFGTDFWNDKLEMLLAWNRSFPPDEEEVRRNGLVEAFQGNRNPYVDDPSLADQIGADGFRRASRWDNLAQR